MPLPPPLFVTKVCAMMAAPLFLTSWCSDWRITTAGIWDMLVWCCVDTWEWAISPFP